MTAREFARRLEEPYTTIAGWLQRGLVPGAEAHKVGTFKVWVVPVKALETVEEWRPARGRPPLTDEEKESRTKKASAKKSAKKAK